MNCESVEIVEIDDDDEKSGEEEQKLHDDIVDIDDSSCDTVFSITCEPQSPEDVVFDVIEVNDDPVTEVNAMEVDDDVAIISNEETVNKDQAYLDSRPLSVSSGSGKLNICVFILL